MLALISKTCKYSELCIPFVILCGESENGYFMPNLYIFA